VIRLSFVRRIGGTLLLLVAACRPDADEAEAPAHTAEVAASIDTVREDAFVETVDGVGTVVARIGHVAVLAAPSPTRITKIYVEVGDRVAMGAPLVDLEQPAFDAAVASAEAALRAAEQAAARATRLVEAGVAPRKDAEAATAALEAARRDAVTARRARELAHVQAPFAGVVTRLAASLGANVDVGQPLVEVTDPSVLDVLLSVAPADARRLQSGQSADLFENAGKDTTRLARGRVADVSVVVDSLSRGVPVRLALLSNAGGRVSANRCSRASS
jgi:RND family efflux transporter MFP subunit